jgi:hypothetical protein
VKQATLNKLGVKAQATQIKTTIHSVIRGFIPPHDSGLEYGAGLCHGAKALGLESFEPFPKAGVNPTYTDISQIRKKFDFILCTYVLNVVAEDERLRILKNIKGLMKGGCVILVVRGVDDFKKKNATNDYFMKKGNVTTFQHGFTPTELSTLCNRAGFHVQKLPGSSMKSIRVLLTKF